MTAHLNNNSRTLFKKAHQYTVQDSLSAHCSRQLIKAIIQEHCSRQLIQGIIQQWSKVHYYSILFHF